MSCNTGCNDNVWYDCGSEHSQSDPFKTLFNEAASGKEEIMCLNNRLADVFQHFEDPGGKTDCEKYLLALSCLQDEIKKVKAAYETEISRLRREIEKQLGDKNNMMNERDKCNNLIETTQLKLQDAQLEAQKRKDELDALKNYTTCKEKEVSELTCVLDNHRSELELMCPKLIKYQQDSEIYRCQWEQERKARAELEQMYNQLCDKLNFESRMHQQQIRDFEDRLKRANDIITKITEELKEAKKGTDGFGINAILQKMREQMMSEFQRYKQDTEDTVNQTLKDMRCELERRKKEKLALEEERDRLSCMLSRLQGQINDLEGMLDSANRGNCQLQNALQNEKIACCKSVRELEGKLAECQESIMMKIREVAAARDVQTQLKSEIESYKILLECQENKMSKNCKEPPNLGGSGMKNPSSNTHGYPTAPACGNHCGNNSAAGGSTSGGAGCGSSNPCSSQGATKPCVGTRVGLLNRPRC